MFSNVYAYENNYFSIELDPSFKEKNIEDKKYIFSSNNDYISITITNNKDNYDVSKFNENDIQKQKEYLEKEYKNKFSNKAHITNIELKNNDTIYYLEYDLFYESKDQIGYNIYQRCRMYTTNNYVYSILYNSDKEITNNDYLDSFKIKDSYLRRINTTLYIILSIIMLILLLLINYRINKKRRK